MKVLSASQIREADAFTIKNEPIASIDLMERASRQLYYWFQDNVRPKVPIVIFSGMGNNGGDGLALSRMLLLTGWEVRTIIVEHSSNPTNDFQVNLERLQALDSDISRIDNVAQFPKLRSNAIIVDAILGSGLNSPLRGLIEEVVDKINSLHNSVISIDIPTGLFADDNSTNVLSKVLKADFTLAFQSPKLSFMLPDTGNIAGDFDVLDIGLNEDFLQNQESNYNYINRDLVQSIYRPKSKFDHKGSNGHAVIIGGSQGKFGAVQLASYACLKAGAGLVSACVSEEGVLPLQTSLKEIMVVKTSGKEVIEEINIEGDFTFGIGPGIGTHEKTASALIGFLGKCNKPVVLDADGLNILSKKGDWSLLPKDSILTPHPGEFARMIGEKVTGIEAIQRAINFAFDNEVIIVLKGAHTAVITPNGEVYFNGSGNPGMATAGSGDVLTGIITSLLAQEYPSIDAALMAVYIHGLAGDYALMNNSYETLISGDIIKYLSYAFEDIQ